MEASGLRPAAFCSVVSRSSALTFLALALVVCFSCHVAHSKRFDWLINKIKSFENRPARISRAKGRNDFAVAAGFRGTFKTGPTAHNTQQQVVSTI